MLVKFEVFLGEFFDIYQVFKKHFWQSIDAILKDVSVAETII